MLKQWVSNLPDETLQEIAAKARPGTIRTLASQEIRRRQGAMAA